MRCGDVEDVEFIKVRKKKLIEIIDIYSENRRRRHLEGIMICFCSQHVPAHSLKIKIRKEKEKSQDNGDEHHFYYCSLNTHSIFLVEYGNNE